jgi:hypothetical protein
VRRCISIVEFLYDSFFLPCPLKVLINRYKGLLATFPPKNELHNIDNKWCAAETCGHGHKPPRPVKPKVRKYPLSEAEVAEVLAILQPRSENPASGTAEGLIDEEEIALDVESDCDDLESTDSDGGHSGASNSSGRGGS